MELDGKAANTMFQGIWTHIPMSSLAAPSLLLPYEIYASMGKENRKWINNRKRR